MSILQNSNSMGVSGNYQILNSLRFQSASSQYLSRTFASSSNNSFTLSAWIKRGTLGVLQEIFAQDASNMIEFSAADEIKLYSGSTTVKSTSTAVFRDPSAWYHIVIVRNGGQMGTTSVWTIYVNNQSVLTYTGTGGTFLTNAAHYFGRQGNLASQYFDGYMTEINLVDNQALTPSSFGTTDPTSGQWIAKAYTGTYGTNGFYLPFTNGTSTTTLGWDMTGGHLFPLVVSNSNVTNASGNVLSIPKPTGVVVGDVLVAFVIGNTATFNTPSGWTLGTQNFNRAVFYKVVDGTEGSSFNFTITGGSTSFSGDIVAYRNVTLDVVGTIGGFTNTAPSVTLSSNNSLLVLITSGNSLGTDTYTANGFTSIDSASNSTSPSFNVFLQSNVSAGNTGTISFTSTGPFDRGVLLGLRPKNVNNIANGNDWTLTNFTRSAGVSDCWMYDVPSGNGGANGTQPNSNYCVLNPLFNSPSSQPTFSNGNLYVSMPNDTLVRASISVTTAKWYCEIVPTAISVNNGGIGIQQNNVVAGTAITSQTSSIIYASDGTKRINGASTAYGASYGANAIIGVAIDMVGGTVTFYKNNISQGALNLSLASLTDVVIIIQGGGAVTTTAHANFGQRSFAYTPPTGFKALCTSNLPTSTIVKGSNHMNAVLQLGSAVDTGANLFSQGGYTYGLVWGKDRTSINDHQLVDTQRGTSSVLQTNTNLSEKPYASPPGTDSCVAWAWNANASGVINTDGSITSNVSVNATAGFSVVTYTGTGANATVGHGLGVAPKMIILKCRTSAYDWLVYHGSLANTQYLLLNTTAAVATGANIWNSTTPTSSVFSIGTNASANRAAGTYVAYCFAEISGYSKAFSFTGNGSNDGIFIYTGFLPRFVMLKRTDTTGDWYMWDTARNTYDVITNTLLATSSAAETSATSIDALSNGFKMRNTTAGFNANGGTYIGFAWATNPFQNSNAF